MTKINKYISQRNLKLIM